MISAADLLQLQRSGIRICEKPQNRLAGTIKGVLVSRERPEQKAKFPV
jgi:hypothetical protein